MSGKLPAAQYGLKVKFYPNGLVIASIKMKNATDLKESAGKINRLFKLVNSFKGKLIIKARFIESSKKKGNTLGSQKQLPWYLQNKRYVIMSRKKLPLFLASARYFMVPRKKLPVIFRNAPYAVLSEKKKPDSPNRHTSSRNMRFVQVESIDKIKKDPL